MKKKAQFIASLGMLFIFIQAYSQSKKDFSAGWSDGYEEGYCEYNLENRRMKPIFIVPISPIARIGYDTYKDGYKLGLREGKRIFLKRCNDCDDDGNTMMYVDSKNGSFNDGWGDGYEEGYCEYNLEHSRMKPLFIVPISPIARIGYDTYKDGYKLGFREGKRIFLKRCSDCDDDDGNTMMYVDRKNGSFKDGWETGYEDGYCEYNLEHRRMKPLFIVPISPIAPIGYNDYKSGYRMGFKKGKDNFK